MPLTEMDEPELEKFKILISVLNYKQSKQTLLLSVLANANSSPDVFLLMSYIVFLLFAVLPRAIGLLEKRKGPKLVTS